MGQGACPCLGITDAHFIKPLDRRLNIDGVTPQAIQLRHHNLSVSDVINHVAATAAPDQRLSPAVRAWVIENANADACAPPTFPKKRKPRQNYTPKPPNPLPTTVTESADYAASSHCQKLALGDIQGKLMWWCRSGKYVIVTRWFAPPVVLDIRGELVRSIRWNRITPVRANWRRKSAQIALVDIPS
jgi:hypothetical protein